jgi:hypothetical protein
MPPLTSLGGLFPVYTHLFVLGWLTQLIFGVVFWMFPNYSTEQPRRSESLGWWTYALLNIGLLLRVIIEPIHSTEPNPISGWTLVASTDVVLIPVAPSPEQYTDFAPDSGWRHQLVRTFDRILHWGQIQADDGRTVNGPWFGAFCHTVCWVTESLWNAKDRAAWERQIEELAETIVRAVRRDSGRRMLVAVQCQRLHRLIPLLHAHDDLFKIVAYQNL